MLGKASLLRGTMYHNATKMASARSEMLRPTMRTMMLSLWLRQHPRGKPRQDRWASVRSAMWWSPPPTWVATSSSITVRVDSSTNQPQLARPRLGLLRWSASSVGNSLPEVTLPDTSKMFIRTKNAGGVIWCSPSNTATLITRGCVENFWAKHDNESKTNYYNLEFKNVESFVKMYLNIHTI